MFPVYQSWYMHFVYDACMMHHKQSIRNKTMQKVYIIILYEICNLKPELTLTIFLHERAFTFFGDAQKSILNFGHLGFSGAFRNELKLTYRKKI